MALLLRRSRDGRTPVRPQRRTGLVVNSFATATDVADLGAGALYIVSWLLGWGFADDPTQAARATYEYGTTLLLVAGLLNYLTMLDAFDIAAGRKP